MINIIILCKLLLILTISNGYVYHDCCSTSEYLDCFCNYPWPDHLIYIPQHWDTSYWSTSLKPKDWICPTDSSTRFCPSMSVLKMKSLYCDKDEDCNRFNTTVHAVKCCQDNCFSRTLCRYAEPKYW